MIFIIYFGLLLVGIQVFGFVVVIYVVFIVCIVQGVIVWVILLVFMLYLILLLYLVFGCSCFDVYIEVWCQVNCEMYLVVVELDWCFWVEEVLVVCQVSGYKGFKVLVWMICMLILVNNWVCLLVNGEVSFEVMFKVIFVVCQVILVQFFIVCDDVFGQCFQ